MTSYLLRRLLFMIPTLLGITFLIFMLVAMSPGGIGAAMQAASGAGEANSLAQREAYLEDRYGLDDPVVVQYARWLGRISPIKFGQRDQQDPTGAVIRPPRKPKPPALAGEWYEFTVPQIENVTAPALGDTPEERTRTYRRASEAYAAARTKYVDDRSEVKRTLSAYALAADMGEVQGGDGKLNLSKFRTHGIDESTPELKAAMDAVRSAGQKAAISYAAALAAREALLAVYRAKPFPEVGLPIISGFMSVGPPDFGVSFSKGTPVLTMVRERLPVTLMINFIAFPIIYLIAIPTGLLAATYRGSWFDVLSGALFVALWSVPVVWAGVLLLSFVASDRYLGWFPVTGLHAPDARSFTFLPSQDAEGSWQRGYVLDTLWHICLPVACLVYAGFAVLSKQTRAAMLDNFNADYVRTAKAKGVAGHDIVFKHVFRNSLLPLITMFATVFPAMLSGSVVIERIFGVPGMGSLIIESIALRDREVLLANALMIGIVNLLALLLADILYAMADPRISYK